MPSLVIVGIFVLEGCGAGSSHDAIGSRPDASSVDAGGCEEGARDECYSGPPGTVGIGNCVAGTRSCSGGSWQPCEGEIVPRDETCDRTDENCDGEVDRGLECGPCREEDVCRCVGAGCEPFGLDGSVGVSVDGDGALILVGAEGSWRHHFEGQCESLWNSFRFEAELPGSSEVEVLGRWAHVVDALDATPWEALGSIEDDGLVLPTPSRAQYELEVLLQMRADPDTGLTPRIQTASACFCWASCTS